MLTEPQLKDLEIYKQTGELGSLENVFIEDCLEQLIDKGTNHYPLCERNQHGGAEARARFNLVNEYYKIESFGFSSYYAITDKYGYNPTEHFRLEDLKYQRSEVALSAVLTLLSRTPDGQAIMPFLDVEMVDKEYGGYLQAFDYKGRKLIRYTLDRLLYCEFAEALRIGKGFEEALKAINKLYIDHIYV